MATRNTILLNGSPVEVTPLNWQSVAKARLEQDAALSPANKLAEYQAIQQLGGSSANLNYKLDAQGAAVPNTQAYDALQNTWAVQGATAVEDAERATFGQSFVDTLHSDSEYVLAKGSAALTWAKDALPAAARSASDYFAELNGTLKLALVAAIVGGAAFIVYKVAK
jgi:hypothetical protein